MHTEPTSAPATAYLSPPTYAEAIAQSTSGRTDEAGALIKATTSEIHFDRVILSTYRRPTNNTAPAPMLSLSLPQPHFVAITSPLNSERS